MKQKILCLITVLTISILYSNFSFSQVSKSNIIDTINGKKYYIHTVEKGQTLYGISKAYDVSIDELIEFKEDTSITIKEGEILKIFFKEPKPIKPTKVAENNNIIKIEPNLFTKGSKPFIEWVSIPGGTFIMGSPLSEKLRSDDETQHEVTLKAFKISKYEITVEQYKIYCDAKGKELPVDYDEKQPYLPITNISWEEATEFAEWMGCRLPTEAEWEYAARAGSKTPFNVGECLSSSNANFNGDYPYSGCNKSEFIQKILPVGSFPPNKWGLHDMHGNVWEWCSDWYGAYPIEKQIDPTGPSIGEKHIFRGGSYVRSAKYCRSANRNDYYPDYRYFYLGIRLVKK